MKEIANELIKLYEEKNQKYGNSFSDLYEEFGPISAVTQILHKANRLKYLVKHEEDLTDTLMDLANYSMMTIKEIKDHE